MTERVALAAMTAGSCLTLGVMVIVVGYQHGTLAGLVVLVTILLAAIFSGLILWAMDDD